MRLILPLTAMVALALPTLPAAAASAVQKECSTRYQAAKSANTLNGQTYNQYYKQCAAELRAEKTTPATPATPAAPVPTAAPAAPAPAAPAPTTTARAPAPAGAAVFPAAVSPKYQTLSAGKARFNTCLDQYRANKANGGNGPLKWLAHDGYYSQCNTRLKS